MIYLQFRIPLLEQMKMPQCLPTLIIHHWSVTPIGRTLIMPLVIYHQIILMRIVCPLKSQLSALSYKLMRIHIIILIVTDWMSSDFLFINLYLPSPRVSWCQGFHFLVFSSVSSIYHGPDHAPTANLGLAASSSARITINFRRIILTPALSHFFNGSWKFKPHCLGTEGQWISAIASQLAIFNKQS